MVMAKILTETKKGVKDMSEKQPHEKLKNIKVNRAAVVTANLLVAALAVLLIKKK
jgi:hypothetical protein